MTQWQRDRMIDRFLAKTRELPEYSLEHRVARVVTLGLAYGAGVRRINAVVRSIRLEHAR